VGFGMTVMESLRKTVGVALKNAANILLPGEMPRSTSEMGIRTTPENYWRHLTTQQVDYDVVSSILDIRRMHRRDPRVRKIHDRIAKELIKGGLRIRTSSANIQLKQHWHDFERRLNLHRREKLESDARGFVMEGNLPIQWVLDMDRKQVVESVRMPTETIIPLVDQTGKFIDPRQAYRQTNQGIETAIFALWQLNLARLAPENYDDFGCLGRPLLDSSREHWQKLNKCENSLVTRRISRAHLRLLHNFSNSKKEDIAKYREEIERDIDNIRTDYYTQNATVTPIQGDASLSDTGDIVYLLETFFAASILPKGLLYPTGVARDILEQLKNEFYEELDSLQDIIAFIYEQGFRLDLLLKGVNPDAKEFSIIFAERRTDSRNLNADLALKYQAIGIPKNMLWETVGFDDSEVREEIKAEQASADPYPNPNQIAMPHPQVNITPGNAPLGESATTITTRN
jgi:hypothetical protein